MFFKNTYGAKFSGKKTIRVTGKIFLWEFEVLIRYFCFVKILTGAKILEIKLLEVAHFNPLYKRID